MSLSDKGLERVKRIYEECEFDVLKAASQLNVSVETLKRYLRRIRQGTNSDPTDSIDAEMGTTLSQDFRQNEAIITTKSLNIKTIEEAMEYANIDTEIWEAYRSKINSWEVTIGGNKTNTGKPETYTNWQVTVFLRRKAPNCHEDAIKQLIEKIPSLKLPKSNTPVKDSGKAVELCPFDVHFGKLAWGKETGHKDYDTNIAKRHFLDGIMTNLEHAKWHGVEKIYYILGQDIVHIEMFVPETYKGGNVLDVDSRLPKVIMAAESAVIESLYACLEIAPTEVIWIPGNHDAHASFYLCEIVKQHFRNEPMMIVDNDPKQKKARLWGTLLVGWTHEGTKRQTNLVNILPQFWPELWGKSQFREWHTGHKHKKDEWKFLPVLTEGGTIIRQIPTLSQIDAWHVEHDFVSAVPATESFIWTKNRGICDHYTANVI
jgi:hypothetical protein